jgi:hypothetical protein
MARDSVAEPGRAAGDDSAGILNLHVAPAGHWKNGPAAVSVPDRESLAD